MAARHCEGNGSKRPGDASRPPGPTAGSHRQRPPSTGAVQRDTRDDGLAPPPTSRGSLPPPPTHPEPQPAGRTLSHRIGAAPTALTRARLSAPPPFSGLGGTAPPGDATAAAGDTHVRRGRLGPRQGKGTRAVARAGRGGKAGSGCREGPQDRGSRGTVQGPENTDTAGPPGKPARDPTATHTRGRSRDAWDSSGSRPSPERAPRLGHQGRRAVLPSSSICPRQIHLPSSLTLRLDILGTTFSSEAALTVTACHHRLQLGQSTVA